MMIYGAKGVDEFKHYAQKLIITLSVILEFQNSDLWSVWNMWIDVLSPKLIWSFLNG